MARRESKVRICPRCGLPISWIEKRKTPHNNYYYAVHRIKVSKNKVKIKKCYLGPIEDYIYVTRLHEDIGLVLKGMNNGSRVLEYLRDIHEFVERNNLKKEFLLELKRVIEAINDLIDLKLLDYQNP